MAKGDEIDRRLESSLSLSLPNNFSLTRKPATRSTMSTKKSVHTIPSKRGKGWVNKVGGKTVSRHRKKKTAVKRGRQVARKRGAEHRIHNRNGQIGRSNSYGNDPFPPRDKNR
jgi:hypothetical protein